MKLNKILLAGLMTLGVVSVVNANTGTVSFEGQVVDTPCSLDPDSENQLIKFGTLALSSLTPGSTSVGKQFSIKLQGCDTTTLKTADVTFAGDAGHTNTFGVKGSAKNIGILITGDAGPIAPGDTDSHTLVDGNNTFTYEAAVAADPASAVTAGNFTSVANYTVSYQ